MIKKNELVRDVRVFIGSDEQFWYQDLFMRDVVDPLFSAGIDHNDYNKERLKIDAVALGLPVSFQGNDLYFHLNKNEALMAILRHAPCHAVLIEINDCYKN